ncbi:hypothetical protein TrLO_g5458 [Triparma laevis f. longispina]|uniref:Uncharacterized protein n=1 Tax=Triparma laevis f. longispina TaxID=1714387 RepID=A0A9W7DKW5_9STRA|nr:hypothetical protein TrLO_g5458 [Triparma laevis f. longispina]
MFKTNGGMWDQSSASYWKDQEKKKARQKKLIAVGCGVLIALMFIVMSRSSGGVDESASKGVPERPAIDSVVINDCMTAHTNYHRTYTGDCGRVCKDTLAIPPVPGVYRTCLEGCTLGINMAYGITCKQGSVDDCQHAQSLGCVEICKPREETQPAPKIHRQCLMACKEGFNEACAKGQQPLEDIVNDHWTALKKRAKAKQDL